MRNIAHRGFSGKYPENTTIAFKKAIELGVDMIELDVTLSKNKIPVVIHDDTLERTTNGKGKVRNALDSELKLLDAGSWKNINFSNEKIPTLEEVLSLIKKESIELNIEIKSSAFEKKISDSCIEQQTLNLIRKYRLNDRVVISSFEPKVLLRLRELSPQIKLAYLIEPNNKNSKLDPITFVKKIDAVSLNMHQSQVKSKIFQKARASEIPICVYTVNSVRDMQRIILTGVSAVFTNYPDKFKILIGQNK